MARNRLRVRGTLLFTALLLPVTTAPAAQAGPAAPATAAISTASISTAMSTTAKDTTGKHRTSKGKGKKKSTAPSPTVVPPASRTEQEPTSAELQAQQAKVAELKAEATRQAAGVDDAQEALEGAAVLAGQALEEYASAVRTLSTQQQVEHERDDALTAAQQVLDENRRELGRWARQAYAAGSGLGSNVGLATVLSADAGADVTTNLNVLHRIGRARGRALTAVRITTVQADAASVAAAEAAATAADAAVAAASAKDASEEAVNVQRRLLGVAETSLADTNQDVSAAAAREAGLRAALLAATPPVPRSGSGSSQDNRVTGQVGSCVGGEVEQYPNGQIPTSALCPIRAGAGHYLRADAAYAFDRMAQAYAGQFGTALCVTDSYRSYAAQVSVYARKPGLAAVPGTSNHGWGTATDLCGGIQSFTSTQHRWMTVNAPLYGWFHPGWAQSGGSKPEPWHWEYGG